MTKSAPLAAICLAALGCGGGTADHSSSFTGSWSGTGSFSAVPIAPATISPGSTGSSMAEIWGIGPLQITSKSLNSVDIAGICPGGDGPSMDVVSAFVLSGGKYTCNPTTSVAPGCSTASTVAFDGGSGTVANDSITLALTGKYTFCGQDYVLWLTFSGFRG